MARRTAPSAAAPLRIYYDRDCAFCLKTCRLLQTFLILPQAVIAPAQDTPRAKALLAANNSWVVIDHDDQARLKWAALTILLRLSPLFGWLGVLLGSGRPMRLGDAAYDFVGRHRAAFAGVTKVLLPWREPRFEIGRIAQSIAGFMLFVLLAWNLCTVGWLPNRLYAALTPPLRVLRVDQYWNMFAPFPSHENGWFIVPATLADGREIDLRHPERGAVSYEKPADVAAEYPNSRWLKYFERLWSAQFSANRPVYSKYLCQSWNAQHSGGEQLHEFKLIYMLQMSVPSGQTPVTEQRVLSRYDCQAAIH
jgi:predicted DCC family thiol-disulfide oxidoreductase YuxK